MIAFCGLKKPLISFLLGLCVVATQGCATKTEKFDSDKDCSTELQDEKGDVLRGCSVDGIGGDEFDGISLLPPSSTPSKDWLK